MLQRVLLPAGGGSVARLPLSRGSEASFTLEGGSKEPSSSEEEDEGLREVDGKGEDLGPYLPVSRFPFVKARRVLGFEGCERSNPVAPSFPLLWLFTTGIELIIVR